MAESTISVISPNDDLVNLLEQFKNKNPKLESFVIKAVDSIKDLDSGIIIINKQIDRDELIKIIQKITDKTLVINLNELNKFYEVSSDNFEIINFKKPYLIEELLLKINGMIISYNNKDDVIDINNYKFSLKNKYLQNNQVKIDLTDREAEIINFLNREKKLVNKNVLLEKIWGYGECVDTHTLETHIYRLRQKLVNNDELIVTEGSGYKIVLG